MTFLHVSFISCNRRQRTGWEDKVFLYSSLLLPQIYHPCNHPEVSLMPFCHFWHSYTFWSFALSPAFLILYSCGFLSFIFPFLLLIQSVPRIAFQTVPHNMVWFVLFQSGCVTQNGGLWKSSCLEQEIQRTKGKHRNRLTYQTGQGKITDSNPRATL